MARRAHARAARRFFGGARRTTQHAAPHANMFAAAARRGLRRVMTPVLRNEGDVVTGGGSFSKKERASEDQYIHNKVRAGCRDEGDSRGPAHLTRSSSRARACVMGRRRHQEIEQAQKKTQTPPAAAKPAAAKPAAAPKAPKKK